MCRAAFRSSGRRIRTDRKSTRLNSSHSQISYAVFCLKKKNKQTSRQRLVATRRHRDLVGADGGSSEQLCVSVQNMTASPTLNRSQLQRRLVLDYQARP